jgi:lysophospholipase L1-like esterase
VAILILLGSALVGYLPSHAAQTAFYTAAEGALYYFGRTQRADNVLWTWPASGLRVAYGNSATVALRFRALDYGEDSSANRTRLVWYRFDGGAWQLLAVPPNSGADYPLTGPGDRGRHTLDVVKASEGQLIFDGITLDPGGKLARAAIPSRRIEIVGDSITAGFRINGNGSYDTPADHDARSAYGWLTGDQLNADVRLIAVTGRGLVHDYGIGPDQSHAMPAYYPYLQRGYPMPNDWSWQPSVIVVNLGTNDMAPPGPTPSDVFQAAYVNLLTLLRTDNPRALIVALQPFGLVNGTVPVYPQEIRAAVQARHSAGDNRVMYVDTAHWLGPGDFTDGTHPNAQGNRKAAARLIGVILSLPG